MLVGGYTLDLYCDSGLECVGKGVLGSNKFQQFYAETFAECKRDAQAEGWSVRKRGREWDVRCPECVSRKTRKKK